MKRYSRMFILSVMICSALSIIAVSVNCMIFRAYGITPVQTLYRSLIVGSFFFIVMAFLGIRKGRHYKTRCSDDSGEEAEQTLLDKIGKIPLQFMLLFLAILSIYTVAQRLAGNWIGIAPGLEAPVIIINFSWGMLFSSVIYIFSDKTTVNYLLHQKIVRYPRGIRNDRQSAKIVVVPLFTFIIGVLYVIGLGGSLLLKYENFSNIPRASYLFAGSGLTGYTIFLIVFVKSLSNNHKRVFHSVISQLDQLSSGEKDLTARIFIGSIDEVASIAGLINTFAGNLSESIVTIKNAQEELSDLGSQLHQNAEDSRMDVEQITASVDNMQGKSAEQTFSIQETTSAVEQIAASINTLHSLIRDQAASVTEASASIEEMVSTIGAISSSMNTMANRFEELARSTKDGTKTQEQAFQKSQEISRKSEDLEGANQVIANIAAQTNLLAMNAAIEAAHAGEAGRGFAVVADEIRKLAETSALNSKTISSVLHDVQSGIESVVEASVSSRETFTKVAEQIGSTDSLVKEIDSTIGEQKEGAKQILEALAQMKDITSQVQNGASEMNDGNTTIIREIENLKDHNREITDSIESVVQGIQGVKQEILSVSTIAETTRKTIEEIHRSIGDFRTER